MTNQSCVILFDQNQHGTYLTGQIVTGKVIINIHKTKKFKGIRLQICGYSACQWKQKHGRSRPVPITQKRKKHTYSAREDYIASTTFLVGADEGPNLQLEAGTYTYTFACPIPENCPSSFEGTYGHTRYLAKVTFIRSGASNRTHNVGFTVLKILDLNQESKCLGTPAENETLENFCFFHTDAVHLKVNLTQTGYVPGQFILVSARVNNESVADCKRLQIELNLRATYTSDTPYMRIVTEKMCVVKKHCGPVPRHTQRDFAETIRVSATPPSSENLSRVVRITYEIAVVAVMNNLMLNPKVLIPITIGNVPLAIMSAPTSQLQPQELPTTSRGLQSPESVEDDDEFETISEVDESEFRVEMAPPSYEEAMFMSTDIADTDVNTVSEATRFVPRYPVFNVDELLAANGNGISPPPNPPQKRRRRRKRSTPAGIQKEKLPVESPVQI